MTKKQIKEFRSAIDFYFLYYKAPRSISAEGLARTAMRMWLREVVARELLRTEEYQKASRHFDDNPDIYGESTSEMVNRFALFASDSRKAMTRAEKALAALPSLELPSDVIAYAQAALAKD